jgi:hypothetical protein
MSNLQNRIRRDPNRVTSAVDPRVTKCLYVRLVRGASRRDKGHQRAEITSTAGPGPIVALILIIAPGLRSECSTLVGHAVGDELR